MLKSRKGEHWSGANVLIREHQRTGLTTNARVCQHTEDSRVSGVFVFYCTRILPAYLSFQYVLVFILVMVTPFDNVT
ncbi:hypothetical protein BN2127_JRS7_00436 [Bacillus subtilis]|nr:hypothetical protein BN2127_JRS7_00436 [Bacillus subtilis]